MPEFKTQNALVLSTRPLGERSYIVSIFTQENGRHLGALKRKSAPDIGSFINTRWQARLPEQMGSFYPEDIKCYASGFLDDRKRLACISCVCALLDKLLPERQHFEVLYTQTMDFLTTLDKPDFVARYIHWELDLLSALGFGLDFSCCAGGGDATQLAYVSPKTGHAISLEKGEPYKNKLLILPAFLWQNEVPSVLDLHKGLALTGFFLLHHAMLPHLPVTRQSLMSE